MGKDENGAAPSKRHHHRKSASESEPDPDSDTDEESIKSKGHKRKAKHKKSSSSSRSTRTSGSKRRRSRDSDSYSSSPDYDDSDSYSSDSDSSRRQRKERKRREEKKERRRREKEKEKRRKRKEDERKREKKKKDKEKGKKGAVTNSWGKYGIIKETDMWNKRPEFTAWLLEVKKVNLESLPTWEEKQMFKDFMEDHNTATFPSKKYYNLDAYHQHKIEKEIRKGSTRVVESERTIFNDEEQKRLEQQRERERQKEAEIEALKRSMQGGMAQAMKDQARLKEEMAYQYKLGNFEAAAAIQRRLDPDIAM